ncbi:hypothetical protein RYD26_12440 [Pasteurellaceae bacterium LIM206]|nr:hypothetical protein [Pasteurellaceae bacterium LIM206]
MKVKRYIEVYDNTTDELLFSYRITLLDELVIKIINPDDDDKYAVFSYDLNKSQVIQLGGYVLIEAFKNKDVSFHSACYLD